MFFNGTSSALRAPNRVSSPTNFTASAWVYLRTPQYDLNVLEVSAVGGGLGPLGLRVDGDADQWVVHCQGFDHVLAPTVQQQWIFVALVKQGSTVKVVLGETEYATPFNFTGNGPDLFVGKEFYGEIISVKYWENALTLEELLWEKERSLPFYPAEGYYPLISDVDGLEGTFASGPTPDTFIYLAYDWLPQEQLPIETTGLPALASSSASANGLRMQQIICPVETQDSPLFPPLAYVYRISAIALSTIGTGQAVVLARKVAGLVASAAGTATATANTIGRFLLNMASSAAASALANLTGRFSLSGQSQGSAIGTQGVVQVIRTEASEIMLQKLRIHNRLIDVANSALFYSASIDPNTNRMAIDEQKPIKPAKVTVMETVSYWQRARFFKRWLADERAGWTWVMTLSFTNQHAVLERFEEMVSDKPITIPADPENGLRSVIVRLVSSEYTHPPEQSPNRGSVVSVTFEATVSRK